MKKLAIILIIISTGFSANAQLNLAQYHMGRNSFLTPNQNASYFPNTKWYVSLPGLSGFSADLNSPASYNDLFEVTGDSVRLKLGEYLNNERDDFISMKLDVPLFGLGFMIGDNSNLSFFVNSRSSAVLGMPKDILRWAYNGNGEYLGETYEVNDLGLKLRSYVEVGVGYARDFNIAGMDLRGGLRMKYLAGGAMAELDNGAAIDITTDENTYQTTFAFQQASLRLAGFDIYDDDNIDEGITAGEIGGGGFGLDFGAQLFFNDEWTFNFAVNDIGFIGWSNATYEVQLDDQTFVLEGINVEAEDFSAEFEENYEDVIAPDTVETTFVTGLNPSVYMGATYRVNENGYASGTWANTFDLGRLRTAIGVGYTHEFGRILALSGTFSKTPQQPVDFGAGMMFNMGPIRFHLLMDNIISSINVPNAKRVNLSFGFTIAPLPPR